MLLNEPIAALRTISTTLFDTAGDLLPLNASWVAGQVKLSKNGSPFTNTTNLPVALDDGGDGAFDLELELSEVNTAGTVRVRFYDGSADLIAEYTIEIETDFGDYLPVGETSELAATIYEADGDLLPSATVWSAGMVKVSAAGEPFVNAANLPVAVSGGGAGAFTLALTGADADEVGNLRVRFYTSGGVLLAEYVSQVRDMGATGTSTAAAICDRVRDLIEALVPTKLSRDRFRSYRNEGDADFESWCEAHPTSALRRFQARDDGTEDPPEVSNTLVDMRHFTIVILVAYSQNARYGTDQAMDRDDTMDSDWGLINGTGGIGIYGQANFPPGAPYYCTALGLEKSRLRGTSVDFIEIRARFSYYRDVT